MNIKLKTMFLKQWRFCQGNATFSCPYQVTSKKYNEENFSVVQSKEVHPSPRTWQNVPEHYAFEKKCKKVQNIYKNVYLMFMHILNCIRALTPVLTSKKTRIKGVKKFKVTANIW